MASAPAAAVAASPIAVILTAFGVFFAICGVIVIAGFAVVGGAYAYFTTDLPHFDPSTLPQFETTRIYDRYGNLIDEVSDPQGGNRFEVSLNEISPYLINATVAAEDKTFWTNKGIDVQAIGRAVRNTFVDSSYGSSGASTITMQVIKQAFPDRYTDPTKEDKVRQVFLAYGVAQKYSKEEVLTFYLNQIPYGNRSYGIQAAAHNYFNVDAKDLKLWQASILAGLPQAPSAYDPTVNLDAARSRQLYVLSQMVEQGYITEAQKNDAYAQSADAKQYFKFRNDQPTGAPHFVNYVRQYVESRYGADALYRGGLKIYTTIDMDIQSLAED
ncbi:MAG TPA: transglycosylase domain-containing protein, partial [Thermomicrobiales bacterium]